MSLLSDLPAWFKSTSPRAMTDNAQRAVGVFAREQWVKELKQTESELQKQLPGLDKAINDAMARHSAAIAQATAAEEALRRARHAKGRFISQYQSRISELRKRCTDCVDHDLIDRFIRELESQRAALNQDLAEAQSPAECQQRQQRIAAIGRAIHAASELRLQPHFDLPQELARIRDTIGA